MISRTDRKTMQDFVAKMKPTSQPVKSPFADDKVRAQKMSPRGNQNQPLKK